MINKIRTKISKFLEWLSDGSKEAFGSGRLDCCELNKTIQNK